MPPPGPNESIRRLLAIVGLILIKEAGVPIPVPGDLVVIGAGVAAGRGDLDPLVAIAAVGLAVIGAVGWVVLGRLRGRRTTSPLPLVAAWADACCPACLTAAVLERAT